ncbi:uncharacterized protein LODBEIA_P27660 [Lodderomyces beijingensis]|uniref:non-specific serine/threonine protein kinase n=1 Tax=Lodderomyces beijingensis TaxID=1775926 RepID=A0ABP0ZMF6_9ASCO
MTLGILPILDTQPISSPYVTTRCHSSSSLPQSKRQKPNNNMLLDGYMLNRELRFVRKIGAGTYGLIYLVENIFTKKQFAAKMLLKQPPKSVGSSSQLNKHQIQQQFYSYFLNHIIPKPESLSFDYIKSQGHECPFLQEIALHLKVHEHQNVITIHEVFNLENFAIVILLDYFAQGDLFGNIIDKQVFQKHQPSHNKQLLMKNAMLQLIDAVEYCHQNSVYHCDLKPENIMVRYNPNYVRPKDSSSIINYNEIHLVLIDFGLGMESDLICCNACRGSSFYMAPERTTNFNTSNLIKSLIDMKQFPSVKSASSNESNSKYLPTLAGDIWSLGVLFINITCSRNPWPIASITDNNDVFKNYILNQNKSILSSILPISQQFNSLLNKIFQLNPNNRIDLVKLYEETIRCDFFKDDHYVCEPAHHAVRNKNNVQLFTPPESSAYNSYASEIDDDDDECDEDEYYTDDEEYEDVEEGDGVDNDNDDQYQQQPITPTEEESKHIKQDHFFSKAYAKKLANLPKFALDAIN